MTIRFIPLDALQKFAPAGLEQILAWLEQAAREIAPLLAADRVDVLIVPTERPVPGWLINGYVKSGALVEIGIVPSERSRPDGIELPKGGMPALDIQLRGTLAHELHHAIRTRDPGYGSTLGEALVSEGLAQVFEEEVGCPTPNYALAVRGELLGLAALRARKGWTLADYEHWKWFFGDPTDPTWPWSGGYSLGYVLVKEYLRQTGTTASGAVRVSAADVLAVSAGELERLAKTAASA